MMQSPEIDKLAAAMVKVQSAIGPAVKGKTNPFFKSKYADLGEVWQACRATLQEHEIAVIQGAEPVDGKPYMATMLVHSSGQYIKGLWELTPAKPDAQSMGSAITYMRRYSLAAMVGILSDDDDGNAAVRRAHADANGASDEPPTEVSQAQQTRAEWADRRVGKTAWKAELGEFVRDIEGCADLDSLDVLLGTESGQLLQQECMDWARSWWDGKDDIEGLGPRITRRQNELVERRDFNE